MHIGIHISLVHDSLICLGNDSYQVVKKDDNHEHGLNYPYAPDKKHYDVFLPTGYFIVF